MTDDNRRKFDLDLEKPSSIIFLMFVQSAIFCLIGMGLNTWVCSDEIRAVIPSTFLSKISPVGTNIGVFLISATWLIVLNLSSSYIMLRRSNKYRKADQDSRDKMSVLLDLPNWAMFIVLAMGAFAEEVLFRLGAFPSIVFVFTLANVPLTAAIISAIIFSSLAFALLHGQYENGGQLLQIMGAGIILCVGYFICGNVVTVACAHLTSNIASIIAGPFIDEQVNKDLPEKK